MKYFSGLVAILATCYSALLGTTGWEAFVTSVPFTIPGAVIPIDLSSYTQGDFVGVAAVPTSIAITPDARRALVTNEYSNEVSVLDLTTSPVTVSTVTIEAGQPVNVAITPDGTKAVVMCMASVATPLTPYVPVALDLTTNPITVTPSTVVVGGSSLAITPDGRRALVGGSNRDASGISILNITTTPISLETTFTIGLTDGGIAVTPDGKRALAISSDLNSVTVIDLTMTPHPDQVHTITLGQLPTNVAITPDGTRALVTCGGSSSALPGITVLDLTTTPISVEAPFISLDVIPRAIAITPDGKRAVVTTSTVGGGQLYLPAPPVITSSILIFDLTTSPISEISTPSFDMQDLTDVAISPDQAPTARFTFKRDGRKVTFDASSSTSPIGTIATYSWRFGDGHRATTTSPTITHKYHNLPKEKSHKHDDKPIVVTLTVTNTAGTSTEITFTGRTVSNNGGSSAVRRHSLVASPRHFHGLGKVCHKKKEVFLKTMPYLQEV
jgi:YVTN family beta-propeller protein